MKKYKLRIDQIVNTERFIPENLPWPNGVFTERCFCSVITSNFPTYPKCSNRDPKTIRYRYEFLSSIESGDYIVKESDGTIIIMSYKEFNKRYELYND